MDDRRTTIYLLYSTAENNETVLEAATKEWEMNRRWNRHHGHHSDTIQLDDLSRVQWALKPDEE